MHVQSVQGLHVHILLRLGPQVPAATVEAGGVLQSIRHHVLLSLQQ